MVTRLRSGVVVGLLVALFTVSANMLGGPANLFGGHGSLFTVAPAWADEPESAALKAEIDILKERLAALEGRLAQAELKGITGGITGIGEKAGLPTIELPSGLQGLAISGYADMSYGYNFAEPSPNSTTGLASGTRSNRGRVFDTEPNGFTPHAFELVFEKPITDEMPLGFRTDLFTGDDASVIKSTGLGRPATAGDADFDVQQAYVTARAPIGEGIDFKVGKFVTLLGAEVIESPANWNSSRSYMFGFSIPFTHTGVLASYPLGTTLGVVNGWDIVDDNNKAKTLIGNVTLTPLEKLTLSFNGITGAEQAGDSNDKRSVFDVVATYQATDELTLMANYDVGHESGLAPAGTSEAGINWTGLALYAKYDLSPTWYLAGRWEWFDDKDNVRTGLTSFGGGTPPDIDFQELTLTSQWTLREHVLARLEYRHDSADQRVFFHDT
ncbi:MAG: porin, partial [Candidatus Omnitrophica bacterium]|nr:porin [Candidatus Omnitrophota bacterium]